MVQRKGTVNSVTFVCLQSWMCCLCRYFRLCSVIAQKSCLLLFVVSPDLVQRSCHGVSRARAFSRLGLGLGALWLQENGLHHCWKSALLSWSCLSDYSGLPPPPGPHPRPPSVSLDKVFSQDLITLDTLLSYVWSNWGKGFCTAQTGECREATQPLGGTLFALSFGKPASAL